MRAGFPHSDICGSKLVCQLPAAFRRLPRPSSPVIAKASTTCTYSLDPITLNPLARIFQLQVTSALGCHRLVCRQGNDTIIKPSRSVLASTQRHTAPADLTSSNRFYFFRIFKEQPISILRNQKSNDRLALVCPLASALWGLVELIGIEPTTPWLQTRCSPS